MKFKLPNFDKVKPHFESYITQKRNYQIYIAKSQFFFILPKLIELYGGRQYNSAVFGYYKII